MFSRRRALNAPRIISDGVNSRLGHQVIGTKRAKKRALKISILIANVIILGTVAAFVINASRPSSNTGTSYTVALSYVSTADKSVVGPLDQLSSVDIALSVAKEANLPEQYAVKNQSESAKDETAIAPADTAVVAKPQIVATSQKSVDDIEEYVTVNGDTIASVAAKFGVTSNSIRWSNDLNTENLPAGRRLLVPPVDGVVYTVKPGDNVDVIAEKYRANKAELIAFNNAEFTGLEPNKQIVIPGGQKPVVSARAVSTVLFSAKYGYNGYDPGWCTWYAANRVGVPTNWGNANTWDDRARATPGWTVSKIPQVGAVAQSNSGRLGHVGVVDDVKIEDGVYYIKYSDMNGLAGFNRVGYSDWVVAIGKYQNFIYR